MTATHSASMSSQDLATLRTSLLRLAHCFADRSEAEDLVQETLTRALERRSALRPGTNLGAWSRVVLRNLAVDQKRSLRRWCPLPDHELRDHRGGGHAPVWTRFELHDVERLLPSLPSELRTAFHLHYARSLSLEAIAEVLEVPRSTVGTRLFRARAQLRRALEKEAAASTGAEN